MIVAITGGTGFIGRKLVLHHIGQGDTVRVLSRRARNEAGLPGSVNWYHGDLSMSAELLPFVENADVLYHCAGEIRDEAHMKALHVEGTSRLVSAATNRIGRWVQLSSVGVYGRLRGGIVTEQSPIQPIGRYELTKKLSDDLVEIAGRNGAFEWTMLRPSIVFGEDMPNQSLFQLIGAIDRGHFFFIGEQGASANYIHVDNVIHALSICALLPQASGKVFNLSDYATLEAFVGMIANGVNGNVPPTRVPEFVARFVSKIGSVFMDCFPLTESRVDALTTRVIYPISRIQEELGYRHKISMEAGVLRTVRAWQTTASNR